MSCPFNGPVSHSRSTANASHSSEVRSSSSGSVEHTPLQATSLPVNAVIAATTVGDGEDKREEGSSGIYYGDYLGLDKLLSLQVTESEKAGKPVHDEHLFIVIHQVYELWFKQIIHELKSVREIFSQSIIPERNMLIIINRLTRVVEIEKILVDQVNVLETMTSLDFMDFRDYLVPASGFQSRQFREVENMLGLRQENRTRYSQETYWSNFSKEDADALRASEKNRNFVDLLEKWLERTPGLYPDEFDFWNKYKAAVKHILAANRAQVDKSELTPETRDLVLKECEKNENTFMSLFDPEQHAQMYEKGERRFSHKAMQGLVMIFLYRDEPRFQLPFKMLNLLMDIDALLSKWRFQHMMMVHRMIGNKLGTGGSSGHHYLRTTIGDRYRIFIDLFNISTFLIPRSKIPPLTESMHKKLRDFSESDR